MTNYPIDGSLAATEGIFEIDLRNKETGTTYEVVWQTGRLHV